MALTRKMLKAMGIEDDKADEIIDAHVETVNALKQQRDSYKDAAEKYDATAKELDELKAAGGGDEYKAKYEDERKAFADYKAEVEAAKTEREKKAAYRKLLEAAGIDPRRIDAVMRVTDLSSVELDGDSVKDADSITENVKREWADFIPTTHTEGSEPETPPKGAEQKPDISKMTAAEYIAYKHSQK